jgi:hypothetical protein
MKTFLSTLALAGALAAPAAAQDCIAFGSDGSASIPGNVIVRYTADWSDFDHFNSSGARLTTAGQVLQQDRANVHKFGRFTAYDSRDGYFTTLARRQQLSGARVIGYCPLSPGVVADALVNQAVSGNVVFYRGYDGGYVAVVDLAG